MSEIWKGLGAAALALSAVLACAEDVVLKPFVLASKGPGDLPQKMEATKAALTRAGFTIRSKQIDDGVLGTYICTKN